MSLSLWVVGVSLVSLFAGPCDQTDDGDAAAAVDSEPDVEFVSVVVNGSGDACGLRDDGSVRCWGHGLGSTSPEGEFSVVAAGTSLMCGVRVGGGLECWGDTSTRWADDPSLFVSLPDGEFSQVAVGTRAACGVRGGGELACWGSEGASWGLPAGSFVAVAVGVENILGVETAACGVRVDESLACWGGSSAHWVPPGGRFGSVDVGSRYACGVRTGAGLVCWGPEVVVGDGWVQESGYWSPPGGRFVDVALNDNFGCAVRVGGEVECWGPQGEYECGEFVGIMCRGWGGTPIPPGPFTSVAVAKIRLGSFLGSEKVCGTRPDGRVVCWNDRPPGVSTPAGAFVSVDAATFCGVRAGGEAVCWAKGVEYAIAEGLYTDVRGGMGSGCGLRVDGELTCWGNNTWGAASPPPGPFTAIDVGAYGTGCGLRPGGEAVCWGRNDAGQADPPSGSFTAIRIKSSWLWGGFACGLRADGTAECWGSEFALKGVIPDEVFTLDFAADHWRDSFPGGSFEMIDVEGLGACGIRSGGALVCWSRAWTPGEWAPVEMPRGDLADLRRREPANIGIPEGLDWVRGDVAGWPYVSLDSGVSKTCGLRRGGTVDCWGNTPGSPDGRFTAIAVGTSGLGIRPDGSLERWQMSSEHIYDTKTWTGLAAPQGHRFVALDSGLYRFCGLLEDGRPVCEEDYLNLDEHLGPFTRISAGGGDAFRPGPEWDYTIQENGYVCAIRAGGGIDCWGTNNSGQTSLAPWLDIPPYRDVTAGFAHTCAIGAGGEVVCWGDDRHGQTRSPPGAFTAVSAGQWHTCGLRPDGEIDCWGNGPAKFDLSYDAPPPDRPTEPPAGPFTAIAAGFWHTCALRPDGTVTCWLSY